MLCLTLRTYAAYRQDLFLLTGPTPASETETWEPLAHMDVDISVSKPGTEKGGGSTGLAAFSKSAVGSGGV